ncbi:efflux RND transporter permease subunit [Gloeocapsa sp. PCC 73106]|uniref:efflux RND transporter permease subunit n=1 Tax=Gloeocapsa sp. PCC 73106 TaxID=102232 RepID=UPI0002AC15C2|nr:efflux RND transporter permease subunit [Gloeocapsa sp. PCC 73106]ELR97929.1 cation/multidrug efflux pump [Gloeocapsa sp. PCC 73106]
MSFHLSTWSIKNPVPTIVMFLILGVVGIFSFLNLGIDNNPDIDVPAVTVSVTQRGASPSELESEVTKKIEDSIAGIGNIDEIRSIITDQSSTTTITFILGTDSNQATNDVRNAVAQIRQNLPLDIDDPIIKRLEFVGGSILTYAISSDQRSVEELSDLVDNKIIRDLLNVKGVASIERIGGVDREIRVDLDPQRLKAYNLTATEVNQQVTNLNLNLPGGRSEIGGTEQNVRTLGSAATVAELSNYPIMLPDGETVKLSSLGSVTDGFAEPRQAAYLNNQPVVGFSVFRSTGSTLVKVEQEVKKAVVQLQNTLPPDVSFNLIFTRGDSIRASYDSTINSLIIGCILTIITVGLFLRDWRITLITTLALPLSIIPTFWVMQALGYTLNGMTLLALALAVGNLVDDAICMVENIEQHLQMGKSPYQAALDGAREIGLAVVATTATVVAVFIPLAFMGGVPGQFFRPFGVVVAVSTMFSTLVATTVTPMLSAYLLKSKTQNSTTAKSSDRGPYRSLLKWSLSHRLTTLFIAITFFIGSLQLLPFIPKGLIDSGDSGLSIINVELPPGSQLSKTRGVMQEMTEIFQEQPEVASILTTIGKNDQVNSGVAYVNLVPKKQRSVSQLEFQERMREDLKLIPGVRVSFNSLGGAGSSKDLSIILKSENSPILTQTAQNLEQQMRGIRGLVEIVSSASLVKPEIIITPDIQRATDLGVSVEAIARTASLALIGDNDANLAKFNLPDRQIPIRVQIDPQFRSDIETIKNLRVPGANGTLIPLSAVADLTLGSGPAEINRFNRYRQITLEANLQGLSLGEAMDQIKALPAFNPLPPEVSEQPSGDAKIMKEVFDGFIASLSLSVFCIYAVLVLLYNNFLYPLAILMALPLSVGGAFLGLLIMQKELGLFALIGIVLLMGLVTKNAILLVDFTLVGLKEGKSVSQAIINAGVSRLRPIMMTSISTLAGMVPIALGLGADGSVRSPMAIAVIGGFTTSTLLTLVVVPVIFTYIHALPKTPKLLRRLAKGQDWYTER